MATADSTAEIHGQKNFSSTVTTDEVKLSIRKYCLLLFTIYIAVDVIITKAENAKSQNEQIV